MPCIYFNDRKELCTLLEKYDNSSKYIPKNYQYEYCVSKKDWKIKECPTYVQYSDKSSGCYLTTACMRSMGPAFFDRCSDLETLRSLRDDYLAGTPEGRADVRYYYDTAPKIVSRIDVRQDSEEVYLRLYQELVLPAVRKIKEGDMEGAYKLYRETALRLASIYIDPKELPTYGRENLQIDF